MSGNAFDATRKNKKERRKKEIYHAYRYHRPECLWGVLFKMATTTMVCTTTIVSQEDGRGVKRGVKSLCEAKLTFLEMNF